MSSAATSTDIPRAAGAAALRRGLEQHGIRREDVVSMEVFTSAGGGWSELRLFVKVTTFARDPLGQRFQMLERDQQPCMATETRVLCLEDFID